MNDELLDLVDKSDNVVGTILKSRAHKNPIDENNNPLESRFFHVYYAVLKAKPVIKIDVNEVASSRWVRINKLEQFSKENNYKLDGLSHKTIIEIANKLKLI